MTRNWWTEPLAEEWLVDEMKYRPEQRAARRAEYYLRKYAQIAGDAEGKAYGTSMRGIGAPEAVLPGAWDSLLCLKADLDRALASLTEKQFRAVWACWVEGAESEALAEEECVDGRSVRYRIAGARRRLGKYFAGLLPKISPRIDIPHRRTDY